MATILLTWELGAGLGHLLPLREIGRQLVQRGHRVVAALRTKDHVDDLLEGTGITYIPAPPFPPPTAIPADKMAGFAHILANTGFNDDQTLDKGFMAWNALFDSVNPDLVVVDHSPTALLALRGRPLRAVTLGLAFYNPPDVFPLPHWQPTGHLPHHLRMADEERRVTEIANRILKSHGRPTMERLGQLFNDIDDTILATYREFDPFGARKRYWGHWHTQGGAGSVWPDASGPRVFAYLKPHEALEPLMQALVTLGAPTIVFAGNLAQTLKARFNRPHLRFESQPLDLAQVAAQCDVAITHAGHGTMVSLLLAGKPILLLPQNVEQLLNAQAVVRLNAGRMILTGQTSRVGSLLEEMLQTDIYRCGAQAFAKRYATFTPGQQIPEILDTLEQHMKVRS